MADDHSEGGPCKTPANQNNGDGDDDGKDVGVIMAAFPDGFIGTDGNKPGVVAQFFCEGEEVIFGTEEDSPFKMQLHGIYHEYQTHFRLRVGLHRTPTVNDFKPNGAHCIELRFTQDLFNKPAEDIKLAQLTDEEVMGLPRVIRKESKVGRYRNFGQGIARLTMQLNQSILQAAFGTSFTHGHEKFKACLEKLSKVVKSTQVHIFFIHQPKAMNMANRVRERIVNPGIPFGEYNWKRSGNHQVQWNEHRDFEELPVYAHRENPTFHKLKYWYLTIMYGTLMNEEHSVKVLERVEKEVIPFYLLEDPSSDVHPGRQPKNCIWYFDYAQGEAGVPAFDIGDECDIQFTGGLSIISAKEEAETIKRKPWKATVILFLPESPSHGNVALFVRRSFADEDDICSDATPSGVVGARIP